MAAPVTRAEVEDFLYREAALLDEWKLEEWLTMLTQDACYHVPPNDHPEGDPKTTLFILADDIVRIRERIKRLMSPECHAEYPHSRTRRHDRQCAHHRHGRRSRDGRRRISSATATGVTSASANMSARIATC